jgi:cytochrome c553
MNIRLISTLLSTAIALAAYSAGANSLVDGSAEDGKAKSLTCTACHGQEGNSVMPTWPSIAGQSATYTVTQLQALKDGLRSDPLMSSQAALLSDEDMRNVAVYFEGLPKAAMSVADAGSVSRGQALYRGGNSEAGVAACMACHGPTGRGNPAAGYPAVSGQHATYTAKQLRDYATDTRQSDGKTRIMRDIASRLDEEDIESIASYMQGLQ